MTTENEYIKQIQSWRECVAKIGDLLAKDSDKFLAEILTGSELRRKVLLIVERTSERIPIEQRLDGLLERLDEVCELLTTDALIELEEDHKNDTNDNETKDSGDGEGSGIFDKVLRV